MIRLSPAATSFGVHHDAGRTSVAVLEGMHFGDHKQDEDGAMQRAGQTTVDLEAFGERALHQFGFDEQRGAGAVRLGLELARSFVRPRPSITRACRLLRIAGKSSTLRGRRAISR